MGGRNLLRARAPGGPTGFPGVETSWGRIALVLLIAAVAYWWWLRRPRLDRTLWTVLAVAAVNWFLSALNAFAGGETDDQPLPDAGALHPDNPRLPVSGSRPARNWLLVGPWASCSRSARTSSSTNEQDLQTQSGLDPRRHGGARDRQGLGRPRLPAQPRRRRHRTLINVFAGKYFEAVDEFGSAPPTRSPSRKRRRRKDGARPTSCSPPPCRSSPKTSPASTTAAAVAKCVEGAPARTKKSSSGRA